MNKWPNILIATKNKTRQQQNREQDEREDQSMKKVATQCVWGRRTHITWHSPRDRYGRGAGGGGEGGALRGEEPQKNPRGTTPHDAGPKPHLLFINDILNTGDDNLNTNTHTHTHTYNTTNNRININKTLPRTYKHTQIGLTINHILIDSLSPLQTSYLSENICPSHSYLFYVQHYKYRSFTCFVSGIYSIAIFLQCYLVLDH